MNSATNLYHSNASPGEMIPTSIDIVNLKFSVKNERKLLKVFLVGHLQKLFCDLFQNRIQTLQNNSSMECYTMDSKIIQLLIQGIVETGEYTLEGIAYYTRIPFDVIYDAACGISNQFSITPWVRIVDLYTQVRPEVVQVLIEKLLQIKDKNHAAISSLLNET